ncbi:hypothetical protein HRI_000325400 [Hibiscus trionum]|uniref:U1 small nuclear ribonucleoprotein C n=1 Tax=Hibiscus trionum TaxID=183268 RepID=A0A9W7LJL6_HIBTR|nr:hypothetical protein HRI_000325400 [Hibiscus trionum]
MPRYYCDYCDTYLTHDSPSVRKQHNAGYKHKVIIREFSFVSCLCIYLVSYSFFVDSFWKFRQFEEQQTQSLIDQRIKEHLGQAAAFHQVGAAFNQHLMVQRPRLPVLPTPVIPLPRGAPLPMVPGIGSPVLPRPVPGAPGYAPVPGMPPMIAPPGAPSLPGQVSGLPQPPTLVPPSTVPGTATTPTSSNGAPTTVTPSLYQTDPAAPASGGIENFNASAQPSEAKP